MTRILFFILSSITLLGQSNIIVKTSQKDSVVFTPVGLGFYHQHNNIFIGANAGRVDSTLVDNIAIGTSSQSNAADGFGNISIGHSTLQVNQGINNIAIGRNSMLVNTNGSQNTAVGSFSMLQNTGGSYNTVFGSETLQFNTIGSYNTALGYQSMRNNDEGLSNTAVGSQALFANTDGNFNSALGDWAMYNNTIGSLNTAIGNSSLFSNTTGMENVAVGSSALLLNTEGYSNTATGYRSMLSNTTGYENTAHGYKSMHANTIGIRNTATGALALSNNVGGTQNTAMGYYALPFNDVGSDNTAVGVSSAYNNENGSENTALGVEALYSNTSSNGNTSVGFQSGYSTIGTGNVFLGYRAGYHEQSSNSLYIDNDSTRSPLIYGDFAEDEVGIHGRLGLNLKEPASDLHIKQTNLFDGIRIESSIDTNHWSTYIDGARDYNFGYNNNLVSYINDIDGSYNVFSDRRLKSDIASLDDRIQDILALHPVTYYDTKDATKQAQLGFIAQEVQELFPEAVHEKDGYLSINYNVFGVLAIEALRQQETRILELESKMAQIMGELKK